MSEPTDLTLDQLADEMISRLAQAIGEVINDPKFSGFAVDEERDADGNLLKISFVPCDMQDGMAIRRSERNAGIETANVVLN